MFGTGQNLLSEQRVGPKGTEICLWLITSKRLIVARSYLVGIPYCMKARFGQTNKLSGIDLINNLHNRRKKSKVDELVTVQKTARRLSGLAAIFFRCAAATILQFKLRMK
jgi:hypothetical protein